MASTEVRFLGTGDAFCTAGRNQASYLVKGGAGTLLLDCGATTLSALKRQELDPAAIDAVLLSHLHGDHFAGLPFLFLEYMFETPRRRPLKICGPPETEERVRELFHATYRELAARGVPFGLEFTELLPHRTLELCGSLITPFRVPHQETEISLGFGIDTGRHRILYSGDTGWTEDLVIQAQGTDLFICECCFFETRVPSHLDYPCLQANHDRFGTSRLILTHVGREVLARQHEIGMEIATDGLAVTL